MNDGQASDDSGELSTCPDGIEAHPRELAATIGAIPHNFDHRPLPATCVNTTGTLFSSANEKRVFQPRRFSPPPREIRESCKVAGEVRKNLRSERVHGQLRAIDLFGTGCHSLCTT